MRPASRVHRTTLNPERRPNFAVKSRILAFKYGKPLILKKPVGDPSREGSHMKEAGARREFWVEPLKETNLGLAQPFLDPEKRPF